MLRFGSAPAVVHTLGIDAGVILVHGIGVLHIEVGGGGQPAAVCSGSGDGARIHQGNGGELALAGLGAFAVREVPGGVADGELAVCRGVARAEAWAAEALAHDGAGGDEVKGAAVLHQGGHGGHGAGIHVQAESAVAAALSAENIRRCADVVEGASGAAGDLALLNPDAAVMILGHEIHGHALELLVCLLLNGVQDILWILQQLVDGVGVGRVHRHGDGAFHRGKVHIDAAVVVCDLCRVQLLIGFGPAVDGEIAFGLVVGDPDGAPAGGFGGHDVDGVAVLDGEAGNARADEFHGLVLHIAVFVHRADDGERHVLRADAGPGRAGQINGDHAGIRKVVGAFEKLFCQLAAAFAHGQGPERTVAGVGVGAEDHAAAA